MNRLKELRKEKKQTQKEFAKKIDIPLRTIQSWENSESQIKPDKAQQLADYFGVSVGYLLGYSEAVFDVENPEELLEIFSKLNLEQFDPTPKDVLTPKQFKQLLISEITKKLENLDDIDDLALVANTIARLIK